MSGRREFSVTIFIPTGEPEGLGVGEKSSWSGVGVHFPCAPFPLARQPGKLKRAGVFILWAPTETSCLPRVYWGEGHTGLIRLNQHAKQKDFWTHAAFFTSKDQNLNKVHVQYFEAKLVALAREARRAELDNGNVRQFPALSEVESAFGEAFLNDAVLSLAAVGGGFFEKAKIDAPITSDIIIRSKKGVDARGVETPRGFIVHTAPKAAHNETASIYQTNRDLRNTLLEEGIPKDAGGLTLSQRSMHSNPHRWQSLSSLGDQPTDSRSGKTPKGAYSKKSGKQFGANEI